MCPYIKSNSRVSRILLLTQFIGNRLRVVQFRSNRARNFKSHPQFNTPLIIYIKKLLDSDWLRAVHFKCNSAKKCNTSEFLTMIG